MQKYFINGCAGRGLDLDSRVRPALAFRNLGILPLGAGSKHRFSNGLDRAGKMFQELGLKVKAFIVTLRDLDQHLSLAAWENLKCLILSWT